MVTGGCKVTDSMIVTSCIIGLVVVEEHGDRRLQGHSEHNSDLMLSRSGVV
jgi:hypothetical protein